MLVCGRFGCFSSKFDSPGAVDAIQLMKFFFSCSNKELADEIAGLEKQKDQLEAELKKVYSLVIALS